MTSKPASEHTREQKPDTPLGKAEAQKRGFPEFWAAWGDRIITITLGMGKVLNVLAFLGLAYIGMAFMFGWTSDMMTFILRAQLFFGIAICLGFALTSLPRYREMALGIVNLLIGLGLFFLHLGIAYLLTTDLLPEKTWLQTNSTGTQFLNDITNSFSTIGLFLSAEAICFCIISYVIWFNDRRSGRHLLRASVDGTKTEKRANIQPPSFIPRCWEMSRCRTQARVICPNFIDRIPCWQRRCGCLCERHLANFLVTSMNDAEITDAIKGGRIQSLPGVAKLRERIKKMKKERPWRLQYKACHNCALFVEHQEFKYRHMNWIGFPITLVIAGCLFPLYQFGYAVLAANIDGYAEYLFAIAHLPANFHPDATGLTDSPFEYVLLAVLVLLLSSFVFEITDRCFLKWYV